MKRCGHLFERVCAWENLWRAALKARRGKRQRKNVAEFEFNRENHLLALREQLLTERYRPGAYWSFPIFEPKQRLISAAPYRDRVVHHAVCRVVEPIWERSFIADSYACRLGKGSLAAMQTARKFCRQFRYVLKCDIQKFFPSIDHHILLNLIQRKIKDERLLRLLQVIIERPFPGQADCTRFPGDDLFTPIERRCGLPIGNQTSQFFGNMMLNPLDHFIKQDLRFPGYVRYADDFLICSDDKARLHRVRDEIKDFLLHFRLRIHPQKSVVIPVRCGVPFLGYRLFPNRTLLASKHLKQLRNRLRKFEARSADGQLTAEEILMSLQSWWGYAMHADSRKIVHDILGDFPFIEEIRKNQK